MTSEPDLKRIESLFQAAADLPVKERTAFLDGECLDEPAVRGHVERLLDQHDADEPLTAPPPASGPFLVGALTEGPGSVIGRYKLLQQIGTGGFGVVYMAEQQSPVVRTVALKILKIGMDTNEVVARFEAERQALAMMDHPNIARVLDGGATASGRPYFVMELVRGVSITRYCGQHDLDTTARLELFTDVCHAVQHAHQKGVIHRDLKPSNVLVTLDGDRAVPKVIDFGIAKAMHTRLTERTLFTRYEQFIGTPAYMSPEQAQPSAIDVDTRTDVYALGVLLYEILTGSTPFDGDSLAKAGIAEIQRIIREEEPPRPSVKLSTQASAGTRATPETSARARALRGDLDWIVMKAIEKDRSRRYAAASELAEDIRRHLHDDPVLAGPPGTAYRLGKLFRRHRPAVISAALVAIALVAGIIGTSMGKVAADRNAAAASEEAEHALAALDFLLATLALTDPTVALDPNVSVRTMLANAADDVGATFAEQPWSEVRVRATIGSAYTALNEAELAEPQLRRTIQLVDEVTGGDEAPIDGPHFDAGDFYDVLWTMTNVAFYLERPDAFEFARRAREVGLAHVGTTHPQVAAALDEFLTAVRAGAWSVERDALADVPPLCAKAAQIARERLPADDPRWPIVADVFLEAGYTVWYTPHEPLAEQFYTETLRIQRRVLPPDHPQTATTVGLLVDVLSNLDRPAEAEQLIRDSIEALERVLRPGDFKIALAESSLGENLSRQGRFAEAEPLLRRSHAVIEASVGESNYQATESFLRLVAHYEARERPTAAAPYRDALARTAADGQFSPQWLIVRNSLGPDFGELRAALEEVAALCGGVSYQAVGGTSTAPDLDQSVQNVARLFSRLEPTDDRTIGIARMFMGWCGSMDPVKEQEARSRLAAMTLDLLHPQRDRFRDAVAEALIILADDDAAAGDEDAARARCREALRILGERSSDRRWFESSSDVRIARSLIAHGFREDAADLLTVALEVLDRQLGADHGDAVETRRLLDVLAGPPG